MSSVIDKAGGLKSFLIQAISFVLGSSVILFGISTFYNDFLNKPDVDIKIIPSVENFHNAAIRVTNNGMKPATDLALTISTPGKIKEDGIDIISTQNLSAVQTSTNYSNSNLFQLSIPRLVHGNGSMITIDVATRPSESKATLEKYTVYATYNEGSEFETEHNPPLLRERLYGSWFDTVLILAYIDTIAGIAIIIFIVPYAHRIQHNKIVWKKLKENGKHYSKFLAGIIQVRNALQQDLGSRNKFD